MNLQTPAILAELSHTATENGSPLDEQTKEIMITDIDYKLMKGWKPVEIVRHMGYMENVSPQYSESFALRMMKFTREAVEARLTNT